MLDFALHEQLLEDCHHLGSLRATEVLLNRNAALPWFILVPRTALQDVLDLPEAELRCVMTECVGVSAFIKQTLGYPKVNFAGLGNVCRICIYTSSGVGRAIRAGRNRYGVIC